MRAEEFSFNMAVRNKLKQDRTNLAFNLFVVFAVIKVKVVGWCRAVRATGALWDDILRMLRRNLLKRFSLSK
jgi:hypothetical protein